MGVHDHKCYSVDIKDVKFAFITTSDTREENEDETGTLAVTLLKKYGCILIKHCIVKNDKNKIQKKLEELLRTEVDLIVTSGGTGCGNKDVSIEATLPLLKKILPGFGELFRYLSYKEIGTAAFMSRAQLGITENKKIIVNLPGSKNAVKLALEKLLIPEIKHLIWEASR